jgi:lipopolysaccharide/colanic/teichoic acid biosynthesis glycosyltransferase
MQENITIPQPIREFVPPPASDFPASAGAFSADADFVAGAEIFSDPYFSSLTAEKRFFYDFFKRGLDLGVATLMLVTLSPLIALVALLVKTTSRGPVFFKHRRIGRNGREFNCWKFRTMVMDADERLRRDPHLKKQFDEKFKIDDDPRVTPLGSFLRRTSLDELPQLMQVIEGKMSLIGPRPVIARELVKYSIYRDKLLSIKPGLSGLWQTSGRSETTYAERVLLDMQYIESRGALLDLRLLVKTAVTVVKRSGAC